MARAPFNSLVTALLVSFLCACPKQPDPDTTEQPEVLVQPEAARPPPDWAGEGILVERRGRLPDGAPPWTRVTAEVLEKDGERFLYATGKAGRIKDPSLAMATAEARAREEIARWIASPKVTGSRPVAGWTDPKSGVVYVRVELEVTREWVPGQRLSAE